MGDSIGLAAAVPQFSWNDTFYVELLPPERIPPPPGHVIKDGGDAHVHSVITGTDLATHNISASELESSLDLLAILGPRRQELYKVIPVTVVYCIIFITGIIGNVCTCIVIARNKYMQTATNYYLFNLAVADLLVLILGLPQETYMFWSAYPWVFGDTFCVIRTMAAETSTYASILTITAFTVERYVAICHPMRAQTMSSLTRAVKVIVCIWVISGICSIPMVLQFDVVYIQDALGRDIPDSASCTINQARSLEHTFEISTFLFFFAPMTAITVLYGLIGLAIRRSTLSRTGSDSSNHSAATGSELRAQQQARARRAVLKMLVAVVIAFFICWAPFHTQRLMVIYIQKPDWTPSLQTAFAVLYYVSGVLYYVSSVINPILYNIMSLKFRQAFRNTIFKSCRRKRYVRQRHLAAYKFYSKPLTDSNTSALLKKNLGSRKSPIFTFRGLQKNLTPPPFCNRPLPSTSSNSCSGGSNARMLPNGDVIMAYRDVIGDPFDVIEMSEIHGGECKSLSCGGGRNTAFNHNWRPYHSYC